MQTMQINCNSSSHYKARVIVFHTPRWLIDNYSEEYLEEHKIFAVCFDLALTVEEVKDYTPVVEHFKNSPQMLGMSLWTGGMIERQRIRLQDSMLMSILSGAFIIVDEEKHDRALMYKEEW